MQPLAVSLGDPAGIGPEIIVEAWSRRHEEALAPFFVVCGGATLAAAAETRAISLPVVEITDPADANAVFAEAIPVLGGGDAVYSPGQPCPAGAQLALASLEQATGLVRAGAASALVTAPVAKGALERVGFPYPGQTEFLAAACGRVEADAVMMLAGPSLRTVPITVHCALAEVPQRLTTDLIVHRARIVASAMARDFGIGAPRLAFCGLNPHAGEDGKFGDEEARVIAPALAILRAEGIEVSGPHPADALFTPRARQTYDVALAMYHDQALVPLKALDFNAGVNVTLGLPIIRTSPDHGTAFSIAGRDTADPGAMVAAIRMAATMATARAAHG